jgi:hypothetical protein
MQLLGAKEEVNATKRRVLKSEKKRDQAAKDLTAAKDEVAASRASNIAAGERLEALEKALRAMEAGSQPEPIVTLQEHEALRQMRAAKALASGGGEEAYKTAMAGIAAWYGGDQQAQLQGRGAAAPTPPEGLRSPTTPQPPAAGEGGRTPTLGATGDHRRLGPAAEGLPGTRKRGPAEEAGAFQRKQEAITAGRAMDEDLFAGAAEVPGSMSQVAGQEPKPMDLDGGGGSPLSLEEQALWERSEEAARAEELGLDIARKITAAKEEAASQAAAQGPGSPGKARSQQDEKAGRRAASRSPYRRKEGEGEVDTAALEPVTEEADNKKVPTDDEDDAEGEPEEAEGLQPDGSPARDAN